MINGGLDISCSNRINSIDQISLCVFVCES